MITIRNEAAIFESAQGPRSVCDLNGWRAGLPANYSASILTRAEQIYGFASRCQSACTVQFFGKLVYDLASFVRANPYNIKRLIGRECQRGMVHANGTIAVGNIDRTSGHPGPISPDKPAFEVKKGYPLIRRRVFAEDTFVKVGYGDQVPKNNNIVDGIACEKGRTYRTLAIDDHTVRPTQICSGVNNKEVVRSKKSDNWIPQSIRQANEVRVRSYDLMLAVTLVENADPVA